MKIQSFLPMSLMLLTVAACSEKTAVEPQETGIPQTLVAEIADDFTRTAFLTDADGNENSHFTWLAGDRIKMQLSDNTFATYEAISDGRSASFNLVDSDVTVYPLTNMGKFSFYPATSEQWTGKPAFYIEDGRPVVYLSGNVAGEENIANLLSCVPMIANNFFRGYSIFEPYLWFHVATAVLKVDIEDVPDLQTIWAEVRHPSYPICHVFTIADDGHIYASDIVDIGFHDYSISYQFLPSGKVSLFIPVPLGEMAAGLQVRVYDHAEYKDLAVATTDKAIKLEAGKGYDLGTVRCHDIDTRTTVDWEGATVTIDMAEGTKAVEVAWLPYMSYSNCSLYDESSYNSLWVPRMTRFEESGTFPFDLPPAEEALHGQGTSREFALVYRTIDEDGFDYYHLAWHGWIPDELYDDVDINWTKVDVGFGS